MTKPEKPSRLMEEMAELASEMHANGTMDDVTFRKVTMRAVNRANAMPVPAPMSGDEIRTLREEAHMSQAVFARCLNLTVGYISQIERGAKRPTGAALALLHVVRRKGIEAILDSVPAGDYRVADASGPAK